MILHLENIFAFWQSQKIIVVCPIYGMLVLELYVLKFLTLMHILCEFVEMGSNLIYLLSIFIQLPDALVYSITVNCSFAELDQLFKHIWMHLNSACSPLQHKLK